MRPRGAQFPTARSSPSGGASNPVASGTSVRPNVRLEGLLHVGPPALPTRRSTAAGRPGAYSAVGICVPHSPSWS
jgi:hypothetical protein